ncbi:MAG: histidinol dehydrogenase [Deltaproteobacteria bacterium]|nr:histidinol dehydrogenase [Deltaproteobacteria bacterium]
MILKPEKIDNLRPDQYRIIMKRSSEDIDSIYEEVRKIVLDVRDNGDQVSLDHYKKYKHDLTLNDLVVKKEEVEGAYRNVDSKVIDALKFASDNIVKFHRAQMEREMWMIEIADGILAGRMTTPLERVGAYIPGRRAVYPSSILMTILPAKIAGVKEIVACTPPDQGMIINPSIIVAADIAGSTKIFKVGGPWGIASMAYGTRTIPKVDKIVGPGNKYVTAAKIMVFGQVGIDSPAGPSEGMIIADKTGNADFITIDLLSQSEHDPDAASILVTTSEELAFKVANKINKELPKLPRNEIITSSLTKHSYILIARDIGQAIDFVNEYAPEHLEIMTEEPFVTLRKIKNAGSIFMGPFSPIPVGDYASGTNHVLPTGQTARMFSGLSVDDFIKKPTFQYLSKDGLASLKDTVVTLAEAEGLPIHARTILERFK